MLNLNNIKTFIKNIFKKSLFIKLLSVILAIVIWFIIIGVTNPMKTKVFSDSTSFSVSVNKMGFEKVINNKTYNVKNDVTQKVSVTISGRAEIIDNTSREQIKVEIDPNYSKNHFKDGSAFMIHLKVTCDNLGVKIADYSPEYIEVPFDEIITKTIKVKVNMDQNPFADGLTTAKISTNKNYPPTIDVTGFKSYVDKIDTGVIDVTNISDKINNELSIVRVCKYLDSKGSEVTGVDQQDVTVSISPGKSVPLVANIIDKNQIPSNKYISENSINPSNVIIMGSYENLKNINSLETEPVSMSLSKDTNMIRQDVKIIFPDSITATTEESFTPLVTVTITVKFGEIIDTSFPISSYNIKLKNSNDTKYKYTVESLNVIDVTIQGKDIDVGKIKTIADLNPSVDVRGYGPGPNKYNLPVSLDTSAFPGIQIIGTTVIATVTITEIPAVTVSPTSQLISNSPVTSPSATSPPDTPGTPDNSRETPALS